MLSLVSGLLLMAGGAFSQTTPGTSSSASQPERVGREGVEAAAERSREAQTEAAAIKREGLEAARMVAEAFPDDALGHALLGSAHYNIGQSELAVQHLKRCLQLNPNQADAYEILARIAYERSDLEESVRLCEEALKRGPANPETLNQLGKALIDLGKAPEAATFLQKAADLPRPMTESAYLLGQAFLQSKEYAKAKSAFQRTISLSPRHTQAHFGLFTACQRLGEVEEAAKYREEFQKLEATDRQAQSDRSAQADGRSGLSLVRSTMARTLFGAAQIHRAHGELDKCTGLLRKAALLDADNPMYRGVIEGLFQQRQAPQEGLKFFQALVEEQPQSSFNHLFVGRFHSRLNNFEGAEAAYLKAQGLAPQRPEPTRSLVDLYLRSNVKLDVALVLARRVADLEPSGANFHLLALACAKNQDRAGALEAIHQALTRSPGDPKYEQLRQQLEKAP